MFSLLQRAWHALVHPQVRLNTDFPLTGARLGKAYLVAVMLFFVFSFVPILAFAGFTLYLLPVITEHLGPEASLRLLSLFLSDQGQLNQPLLMGLTFTSFLSGFLAELWYFRRVLGKQGYKLSEAVGLTARPLRGRNVVATIWAFVWRVALVFAAWTVFEQTVSMFITEPTQPTAEFAKGLVGGSRLVWLLMAAVLAPIFEEMVFRGFLFQALRATFHGMVQPRGDKPLNRFSRWLGARVLKTAGRADVAAIAVSAAFFAVEHLQFQPVTLLMLFCMGCVLAEVFRRTGSLWTGILLHALNNTIATVVLFHVR